jgi:conjugal transfer pilus assembly protein TraF
MALAAEGGSAAGAASLVALATPSDKQVVNYYEDAKKGWYWYQKEPVKPKKRDEEKKQTARRRLPSLKDYTTEELWNMHPDDFQPLLKEFHKKAVQRPTEDNVREYYIVQDVARRKALAYTNVTGMVMQKYPELAVGADYPTAIPGRNALIRQQTKEIRDRIEQAKGDYGLTYFYSPDCQYCQEQDGILEHFVKRYDWEIKKLDSGKETRLASMFNITGVPRLILIYRGSQDYLPVSSGVASLADIEERLYRGIRLLAGEITPEEYTLYDFQRGGAFDVNKPLRDEKGGQ